MSRNQEFRIQSRMTCDDCQYNARSSASDNLDDYIRSGEADHDRDPSIQTIVAHHKAGKSPYALDEYHDTVHKWANGYIQSGESDACKKHGG